MPKTRTTLTIDDKLLRRVKVLAARTGKGDSEVIEDALRRHLGFGLVERVWEGQGEELTEDEAMDLALEAQRYARKTRP